jgi:carbon monoxide dehydrogenase subunit G
MKVRLERTFSLPAGADAAWTVLSDIETVASCMPGAKITERIDDSHYKGTVSIRLGPANLTFRGEIEVKSCDPSARTLQLVAKGTDTTGASFASMDLTARIEPAADGLSALVGDCEAAVGGKAAAFGGRMMDAVSDQILKQFAANFAAKVAERSTPAAAPVADGAAGSTGGDDRAAASASAPPAARAPSPQPEGSSAAPSQLNGLALLWAILRDWLRGLFRKKPG